MQLLHRRVSEETPLMATFLVPALIKWLLGILFLLSIAEHRQFLVQTLTFWTRDVWASLVASPSSCGPHFRLRVIIGEIAAFIDQRWSYMNIGSEGPRMHLLGVYVDGCFWNCGLRWLDSSSPRLILDRVLLNCTRQGKRSGLIFDIWIYRGNGHQFLSAWATVLKTAAIRREYEFASLMFGLQGAHARFYSRVLLGFCEDTLLTISLELNLLFERCRLLPLDALQIRPVRLPQFYFLLIGHLLVTKIIQLVYRPPVINFHDLLFLQCSVSTIYALLLIFANCFKNFLFWDDLQPLNRLLRLWNLHAALVVSAHLSTEIGLVNFKPHLMARVYLTRWYSVKINVIIVYYGRGCATNLHLLVLARLLIIKLDGSLNHLYLLFSWLLSVSPLRLVVVLQRLLARIHAGATHLLHRMLPWWGLLLLFHI